MQALSSAGGCAVPKRPQNFPKAIARLPPLRELSRPPPPGRGPETQPMQFGVLQVRIEDALAWCPVRLPSDGLHTVLPRL